MKANLFRLSMAHPGDVSERAGLNDADTRPATGIVTIIGKTECHGGGNAVTRGYCVDRLMTLLSGPLSEPAADLVRRIPCGLVAGAIGDPRIFVSDGAKHQGPEGGGLIAIIAGLPGAN